MIEPQQVPAAARIYNGVGSWFQRLGMNVPNFNPDAIREAASKQSGCDVYWDDDLELALGKLLHSVEHDRALNFLGSSALRTFIVDALAVRFRTEELRKESPERFQTPLIPPLMVVGMPRTGTTLLHRLLALAHDARSLRYWEAAQPVTPKGEDDRLKHSRKQVRDLGRLMPGLNAKHYWTAEETEECMALMLPALSSAVLFLLTELPSYRDWFLHSDMSVAYRLYKDYLSNFQAEAPDRRLTLKAPVHAAHLSALVGQVGKIHLVQTHRAPRVATASCCSLFQTFRAATCKNQDPKHLGQELLDTVAVVAQRSVEFREQHPDVDVFDVYYDDLVEDPVGTVRSIRAHFGMPLTESHRQRIEQHMLDNPQGRHGSHRYQLEDFGISEAAIRSRFAAYHERFPRIADPVS